MVKDTNIRDYLLNLLFPKKPFCVLCGKKLHIVKNYLCGECEKEIIPLDTPWCEKCGKPLASSYSQGFLCDDCLRENHFFTEARAFGSYQGSLKELIHKFKYEKRRNLGVYLGEKMWNALEELSWPTFDYIVPVPLHIRREQERGFNQSYILARVISEKTRVPILNALKRIKPTKHQTLLDKSLRKDNLKGAFKVVKGPSVQGKNLILIDDVYTTGATVDECSKSLLIAGAKTVYVFTCARG